MSRYAVRVAYPGDRFHGSQVQPSLRTVEGQVRRDLALVSKEDPESLDIRFSSRTDKGVSALGNVFAVRTEMDMATLLKAANAVSEDVYYTGYAEVGEDFNPRHASHRVYRYWVPRCRDPDSLIQNAKVFEGEHDFKRFCRPDGKPTVLTVESIEGEVSGDGVILTFRARYFLWNMIRRMTGALMDVDAGSRSCEDIERALDGEDVCFGIADPEFLTLVSVEYPGVEFEDVPAEWYSERSEKQNNMYEAIMTFYRCI